MPRFEFSPGFNSRTDLRALLLLTPFAAALLFNLISLYFQRNVFPHEGEIGGPLAPGFLFWPGILFGFYVLIVFIAIRSRTFPFLQDYLSAFLTGRLGILTATALLATVLASLYGVSAFWHASDTALVRHPALWSPEHPYAWSEARTVTVACGGRGITRVWLNVGLADGSHVDIGQANEADLAMHFAAIARQLHKARVALGRIRTCPSFLSDFIGESRGEGR